MLLQGRYGGPVAPTSAETGEPDGVTSDRLSTEPRSLLIFLPRLSQVLNVPREALGPKYVTQVATMLPLGGGVPSLPAGDRGPSPAAGGQQAAPRRLRRCSQLPREPFVGLGISKRGNWGAVTARADRGVESARVNGPAREFRGSLRGGCSPGAGKAGTSSPCRNGF